MTTKVLIQLPLAKGVAGPLVEQPDEHWEGLGSRTGSIRTTETGRTPDHLEDGKEKASRPRGQVSQCPCPHRSTCLTLKPLPLVPLAAYLGGAGTTTTTRFQRANALASKRQYVLMPAHLEKGEQILSNSLPL